MSELLLIEKETETERLIRDYFELHDIKLQSEESADAALALLAKKQYAGVLLDTDGLGLDPLRFLARVRDLTPAPVIVLTSQKEEEDVIRILSAGADSCISKPVRPGELCMRVQALLRACERFRNMDRAQVTMLEMRGICIDTVQRRVWVRKREKKMTRKEYDLLLFLMRHPNQAYTKEQLYREVWGEAVVGAMATVTVHIKKLREKVEEKPAYPTIIGTEWGVGYIFLGEEPEW